MSQPNKHIILVHGGFYDGGVWGKVLPQIKRTSPQSVIHCPTLTGAGGIGLTPEVGLYTHVKDILRIIEGIPKDATITLVGHRYAGMIITQVAKELPGRIDHLIYIDTVVPIGTQSLIDVVGEHSKKWRIEEGWKVMPMIENLGISTHEAKVFPQSLKCFTEKTSGGPILGKKTYIICTANESFAQIQAEKIKQMGGDVRHIQASHSPMVTHPEILAAELIKIL